MVRLETCKSFFLFCANFNLHSSMVRLETIIGLETLSSVKTFTFQYG